MISVRDCNIHLAGSEQCGRLQHPIIAWYEQIVSETAAFIWLLQTILLTTIHLNDQAFKCREAQDNLSILSSSQILPYLLAYSRT